MPDDRRLAVVSGGARGIGEAIVAELVAANYRVAIVDVNAKAIARTRESDSARAGSVLAVELSITDRDAVERELARLADTHGPRSGPRQRRRGDSGRRSSIRPTTIGTALWRSISHGTFIMAQVAARQMVEAHQGAIVNISSVSAHGVRTGPPAYAAAKAGVEGLSRLMAVQRWDRSAYVSTRSSSAPPRRLGCCPGNRVPNWTPCANRRSPVPSAIPRTSRRPSRSCARMRPNMSPAS